MHKELSLGAIILTYNEEIHIERCINSIKDIASQIFVIDSFSTDKTVEIAESLGAVVLQNNWPGNHSVQLNWGLDNASFTSDWILRIDADEIVTPALVAEISKRLPLLSSEVSGVVLPLYNYFLGKKIEKGTGVLKILRLFKRNMAVCEVRMMDEHMVLLEGHSVEFSNHMIDNNLNDLTWWTTKHNGYSTREAIQLLSQEFEPSDPSATESALSKDAEKKRKLKSAYSKMPLFWRCAVYFLYRYILKGGFLEGKEGFVWHFLHGFWYRILVDAKVYQIKRTCGHDKNKIKQYIRQHYNIDI